MTDKPPIEKRQPKSGSLPAAGERLVYVMPQEAIEALAKDEITLLELWAILWRGKWLIVGITAVFAIVSIVIVLSATEWYRADVLLAPAEEKTSPGLAGALGGLASIAGVSVGGGNNVEAMAVLRSRDFAAMFIENNDLLPIFFVEELESDAAPANGGVERPDIRDGVKYFTDNIRAISEDRDTRLITVSIEWTDPELAALWANEFVSSLNEHMRQRALADAQSNLNYLQTELAKTSVVTLQQSIGRLLESELQKLMLARGNEEFSFRVIDRAQVPKKRSRPRRTLSVILATFAGGMFAVVIVLIRNALVGAPVTKSET
jgi:uncharacterized protein involved in exopolysaccharide biosynthesis